jgi:hypothetical protein
LLIIEPQAGRGDSGLHTIAFSCIGCESLLDSGWMLCASHVSLYSRVFEEPEVEGQLIHYTSMFGDQASKQERGDAGWTGLDCFCTALTIPVEEREHFDREQILLNRDGMFCLM